MTRLIAIDIGGTHARFASAEVAGGKVVSLGEATKLHTGDYASLGRAWAHYTGTLEGGAPEAVAISFAGPVQGETIQLTNSPWILHPKTLARDLGVARATIVNDFGAVGYAVAHAGPEDLAPLCGPDRALPDEGVISIVGPGTGLGVAYLLRRDGQTHVVETEGGHLDFAPLDPVEDDLLVYLRGKHRRVSTERIVAAPGLVSIYEVLARREGRSARHGDDVALWTAALDGSDSLAAAAFERYCLALGAVAGDIALAQGASAVVIAGGQGQRIADRLPESGFGRRFVAKGRFERKMADMPVKIITMEQPGLFGAAAAFAARYPD